MAVVPWMAQPLATVVQIGRWRFVVHYEGCSDYVRSDERNRNRDVSPGMKLVVCGHCRPPEEQVGPYLAGVGIYEHSHGGLGLQRSVPQPLMP